MYQPYSHKEDVASHKDSVYLCHMEPWRDIYLSTIYSHKEDVSSQGSMYLCRGTMISSEGTVYNNIF